MSRKYNVSKKNKGIVTGLLIGLIGMACVGALGTLSKGFKDWNYKEWFKTSETQEEDTRVGLVKVNLETEVRGSQLTNTSIISYFNGGLNDEASPVFKDVASVKEDDQSESYLLSYAYRDNGGMKLGSSSNLGSFTINLVEDYTFNRCKIVGRNYSALNNQTNVYSCDVTSISVNGSEMQTFTTNESDTSIIAPTESKEFEFDTPQVQFSIATSGKRCTLFQIELWTE